MNSTAQHIGEGIMSAIQIAQHIGNGVLSRSPAESAKGLCIGVADTAGAMGCNPSVRYVATVQYVPTKTYYLPPIYQQIKDLAPIATFLFGAISVYLLHKLRK